MDKTLPDAVRRTDIDGVPCFWIDTGRPTLTVQLLFRHGMADEVAACSGWTHLVEHLALHGRGGGLLQVNGSVSVLETTLDAHGPATDVARFLTDVTSWLSAPAFDELDRERWVLATEAKTHQSPVRRALGQRYGACGPGLVSCGEPGLGRATPDLLSAYAASTLTRQRATLVLDGPPPPGVALHLPDGDGPAVARAVPCETSLPASYLDGEMVLSGVVTRSEHAWALPALLESSLRRKLREEEGGAYSPWAHYEPVDDEHAVAMSGTQVHERLLETVVDTVLTDLEELGRDGWIEEKLPELRALREQAILDPYARAALARRAANSFYRGEEPPSLDEVVAMNRDVTPEAVRDDLEAFRSTLLLGVQSGAEWREQMRVVQWPHRHVDAGPSSLRHRDWPENRERLALSGGVVAVIHPDGPTRALPLAEVAGLLTYPDGSRDLLSSDGWSLRLDPDEWRDPTRTFERIESAVPQERHLPQPSRDRPPRPERRGRLARWAILARLAVAWLRRKIAPNALAGVVGLVGGALLLTGIITGIPTLMIAGVFVLARAASSVKG